MATTAGVISQVAVSDTRVELSCTPASGGTAPYTYQWYRSLVDGFVPGPSNIIADATDLDLVDTGLIPGTQYYYILKATDAGAVSDDSLQESVVTDSPNVLPNSFNIEPFLGMVDMQLGTGTFSAQVDSSETGVIAVGQAVKLASNSSGLLKVVACDSDEDIVFGFVNYNLKNPSFVAGQALEVSALGNVIWLYACAAVSAGQTLQLELSTIGGVEPYAGGAQTPIGKALDSASAAGQLIRVLLSSPVTGA